jgi:hypothetical protein
MPLPDIDRDTFYYSRTHIDNILKRLDEYGAMPFIPTILVANEYAKLGQEVRDFATKYPEAWRAAKEAMSKPEGD